MDERSEVVAQDNGTGEVWPHWKPSLSWRGVSQYVPTSEAVTAYTTYAVNPRGARCGPGKIVLAVFSWN